VWEKEDAHLARVRAVRRDIANLEEIDALVKQSSSSSDVNIYPPMLGNPMRNYFSTTSTTTQLLVQQLQHLLGQLVSQTAQSDASAGRANSVRGPLLSRAAVSKHT
jgi:hypothetical protein